MQIGYLTYGGNSLLHEAKNILFHQNFFLSCIKVNNNVKLPVIALKIKAKHNLIILINTNSLINKFIN